MVIHHVFAYGQQHFDGWACRACQWQSSNTLLDRAQAEAEHDLFVAGRVR